MVVSYVYVYQNRAVSEFLLQCNVHFRRFGKQQKLLSSSFLHSILLAKKIVQKFILKIVSVSRKKFRTYFEQKKAMIDIIDLSSHVNKFLSIFY